LIDAACTFVRNCASVAVWLPLAAAKESPRLRAIGRRYDGLVVELIEIVRQPHEVISVDLAVRFQP
jgi:hypothetical protein